MEASSSGGNWDLNALVEVLTQGEEDLARLDARLASRWPAAEQEKQLLLRAQSCVSQAICMVKAACSGRPTGAASEQALREQDRREMCKNRKMMKKWTSRVHVSGWGGHNDEYSWRKYGQKKILGANHPRAYFRCTHKSATGCQAMKQVQQSNDDPSVIEITYRGEHTCVERLKARSGVESSSSRLPDQDQSLLMLSFRSPKVETDAGSSMEEGKPSSFTFASTPTTRDEFSLPFLSPTATTTTTTTPESKCFSPSPDPWRTSEAPATSHAGTASELAEVVAAAAPANQYDPYAVDVGFMLDSGGFDSNFTFDL